jgi:hypothetical protein
LNLVIGSGVASAADIAQALIEVGFPVRELVRCPITVIEGIAANTGENGHRGVCARSCVGCAAEAVHPSNAVGSISFLTPRLLDSILAITDEFVRTGYHILSKDRINFFSGSNELDHTHCIGLREHLSHFYERNYQLELGALSSDLVFHVSPSRVFRRNLLKALTKPCLWDNICLAIDEQLPWGSHSEYQRYLENLDWVWKTLIPALTRKLDHARPERRGEPRVIVNLLIPGESKEFAEPFRYLYPGGPPRATSYSKLIERYIKPFVGDLEEISKPVPSKHVFTTAVGRLSDVPDSLIFISATKYELIGRAAELINDLSQQQTLLDTSSIRTKIFPAKENRFTVKACRTTTTYSEGELPWPSGMEPPWVQLLNDLVIDVGSLFLNIHVHSEDSIKKVVTN